MIASISIDEAVKHLDNPDIIWLDVRTRDEYRKGHIQNSIHIPVDELETRCIQELPDIDKTIYVYCLSGSRSNMAAALLQEKGYTHVFSISNGLLEWRSKKYPLV